MKYLFTVFFLYNTIAYSQQDTLGPVNKNLLRNSIMIKSESGLGTGFFVAEGESRVFLITNKHVIGKYSLVDSLILSKKITLTLYTKDAKKRTIQKDINIVDSAGKISKFVIIHPNHKIDVAAIEVTDIVNSIPSNDLVYVDTSFLQPIENITKVLSYGSHVFTIGYPAGIRSFTTNLPLVKSGYISSSILGDLIVEQAWMSRSGTIKKTTSEGKIFLVDGLIIPGNSGGPVISSKEITWMEINGQLRYSKNSNNYILGIVSNIFENTGITVVFSSEHILELIRFFK